jgi:hypothetical protein
MRKREDWPPELTPQELAAANARRFTPEELAAANARRFTPEERAAAVARVAAMTEVRSWGEVPEFADDAEEAAWWGTHTPGPGMLGDARDVPPGGAPWLPVPADTSQPARRPPARPINLRLEADTVRRLRRLAERKGTKYQTLLKTFVQERLYEEEKREGLLG